MTSIEDRVSRLARVEAHGIWVRLHNAIARWASRRYPRRSRSLLEVRKDIGFALVEIRQVLPEMRRMDDGLTLYPALCRVLKGIIGLERRLIRSGLSLPMSGSRFVVLQRQGGV